MEEKAAAPPQEGKDSVTPTKVVLQVMPKHVLRIRHSLKASHPGTV